MTALIGLGSIARGLNKADDINRVRRLEDARQRRLDAQEKRAMASEARRAAEFKDMQKRRLPAEQEAAYRARKITEQTGAWDRKAAHRRATAAITDFVAHGKVDGINAYISGALSTPATVTRKGNGYQLIIDGIPESGVMTKEQIGIAIGKMTDPEYVASSRDSISEAKQHAADTRRAYGFASAGNSSEAARILSNWIPRVADVSVDETGGLVALGQDGQPLWRASASEFTKRDDKALDRASKERIAKINAGKSSWIAIKDDMGNVAGFYDKNDPRRQLGADGQPIDVPGAPTTTSPQSMVADPQRVVATLRAARTREQKKRVMDMIAKLPQGLQTEIMNLASGRVAQAPAQAPAQALDTETGTIARELPSQMKLSREVVRFVGDKLGELRRRKGFASLVEPLLRAPNFNTSFSDLLNRAVAGDLEAKKTIQQNAMMLNDENAARAIAFNIITLPDDLSVRRKPLSNFDVQSATY